MTSRVEKIQGEIIRVVASHDNLIAPDGSARLEGFGDFLPLPDSTPLETMPWFDFATRAGQNRDMSKAMEMLRNNYRYGYFGPGKDNIIPGMIKDKIITLAVLEQMAKGWMNVAEATHRRAKSKRLNMGHDSDPFAAAILAALRHHDSFKEQIAYLKVLDEPTE